jgi:hypothetical protein
MGLQSYLFQFLFGSPNPSLHPDYLHRCARIWGRCFWGSEYPDQEILDDIENYRALELSHHSLIVRHKIWQLATGNDHNVGAMRLTSEKLFAEIMAIREVSSMTPQQARRGEKGGRRGRKGEKNHIAKLINDK